MDKQAIENYFDGNFIAFYAHFLPNMRRASAHEMKACCPFHPDREPSFFVNIKNGLFKCFGCGAGGSIYDFYAKKHNLDTKSDFPRILNDIAETFEITNGNRPKKSIVTASYDYLDTDGKLIYQIERLNPKSFRIRRPGAKGIWIYDKKDINILPYRLPEILNASEIIVVEGEKDADNLTALGFTATTNPFGAGKWPDDFGQYFKDKDVLLMPDNDQPGRDHMHKIAENIKNHAASVKWLELPDLPEKGDVSDFIASFPDKGHAAERLAMMIDGARLYGSDSISATQHAATTATLGPCLKDTPEHNPLAFPDIMSGAAGKFVEIYSSHLESAPSFFYMSYLTCLGNVIANKVKVDSEVSSPARLYTLLLGESADDRKSTAISKTVRFFRDAITEFGICHGVGSAEGLAKMLDTKIQLLLIYDEFKAFVSKSKIETSVLLPCVTTLFESNWFENVTVKRTLTIENANLSMLAACTLETYETIFDQSFITIGFPNRLFLCPGKSVRKFAFPKRISDRDEYFLKKDLSDVLRHADRHHEISITDEARNIYQDWYLSIPGSIHSKRIDTYSLRLMQLLAVNEQKSVIDEEILFKVIALSDWQLAVRRRFDPVDADSKMAQMEEKIRRVLATGPMKKRDLKRAVHGNRAGIWFFDTAFANLLKSKEISHDTRTNRCSAL